MTHFKSSSGTCHQYLALPTSRSVISTTYHFFTNPISRLPPTIALIKITLNLFGLALGMVQQPPRGLLPLKDYDPFGTDKIPYTDHQNDVNGSTEVHALNLVCYPIPFDVPSADSIKPVGEALRRCCRLDLKEFALIMIDYTGRDKIYTSPSLTPYGDRIFSEQYRRNFRNLTRTSERKASSTSTSSGSGILSISLGKQADFL